jgi:16S rRNA (adenine1518-N6/adenine1519-N6)-dimethyltransferase
MLRVSLRQMFATPPSNGFYQQEVMTKRPEQLSVSQFVELTNIVQAEMQKSES